MSLANHVPLTPLGFLDRARRVFAGKIAVVDGDGTEVSYESWAGTVTRSRGRCGPAACRPATGWPSWTSTAAGCWPRTTGCPGPAPCWSR